jgi:spore coat polysaccharide biosynthesis protein SpsF (cytidylyltransferase family)
MKVQVIIQARIGSTRLPGKVLKPINGISILGHIIGRLKKSKFAPDILIATTTSVEDRSICKWAENHNIQVVAGSEFDVLDRFYTAFEQLHDQPDAIVRICADNPLTSYRVMDQVLEAFEHSNCDYLSNSNLEPDFLEDGFDVEVFSAQALKAAHRNANLSSDREHVCPWMKRNLKAKWIRTCPEYRFKLSVDTENDFKAVERVFNELKSIEDFAIWEVNELFKRKPEIIEINKESVINSGYHKSLGEDRFIN